MDEGSANKKIRWIVFAPAVLIIVCAILGVTIYREYVGETASIILHNMTFRFDSLYILAYIGSLLFCIYLICSKKGDIILGGINDKPEYSTVAWAAMMFCTFIGTVMVMGYAEPLYYVMNPPFGIEPLSTDAYEIAHMYGQFHWGFSAVCFFVPATILISYYLFVQKGKKTGLGDVLMENKTCHKAGNIIINVLTMVSIVGAVGTSMGLGSPLVCRIIANSLHITNQKLLMTIIYIIWFLVFATSVWKGLDKGIKRLSYFNIIIAFILVCFIFVVSGPFSVLDAEINSIGLYIQDFARMCFYTDPFGNSGFPQNWTVFYWAWYLTYVPLVGIFTARISRGRTIRQVTLGILVFGGLGSVIIFAVLGYSSLSIQYNGVEDLIGILELYGKDETILAILNNLPFSGVISILFAVCVLIFLSTTIDSSAYVLSILSLDGIADAQPARKYRVLWACMLLLFALSVSAIGGLEIMQTISIIAGFPMIGIQFIIIISLIRIMKVK
jgi:BCCT family betaine/carnitine transporter